MTQSFHSRMSAADIETSTFSDNIQARSNFSPLRDQVSEMMRDSKILFSAAKRVEPPCYLEFSSLFTSSDKIMKVATGGDKSWQEAHSEARKRPLDKDSEGRYEVKRGDTLSDIAAKTLRAEGKNPSQMEILKRTKEIAELNKDQIKDINLIKPGMKLRLPGDANETDAERARLRRQAGTDGPDQSQAETERLKRQGQKQETPDENAAETERLKRQGARASA
ncbi:LysM peptidoglycan-binding domain-containing protein [bacterium]|nr:LysM peptidoglycan-binding domain-containing protein [bacterium]MBP9810806.1 LysM peptidoglycan-binding domain-containing protein [bacterium]